ncbi:MAG TPA: DinB family protein [Acidimicrobiales bacterium]|nr:DinB family protein [Acidimicrobiales bacterium]
MQEIPRFERPKPPSSGDERDQLQSWLAFYRATLLKKCSGLSFDDLCRRPVAPSPMSLLGLLRHMTFVEQIWFDARFAGNDVTEYYKQPDNRDADWTELDSATLDQVVTNFEHACETSDELARGHDLDEMARLPGVNREPVDLRWICIHMIEEYARHCGHADIIRELIDDTTGY